MMTILDKGDHGDDVRRETEAKASHGLLRPAQESIESLSMTFTADGKRQRLPLIFYSFLVIIKQITQK